MAKRWLDRQLLVSFPLDVDGWSIKVHLITWLDGSRCIQVMKYATLVVNDKPRECPYKPLQYVQIPLPMWAAALAALVRATVAVLPPLTGGDE